MMRLATLILAVCFLGLSGASAHAGKRGDFINEGWCEGVNLRSSVHEQINCLQEQPESLSSLRRHFDGVKAEAALENWLGGLGPIQIKCPAEGDTGLLEEVRKSKAGLLVVRAEYRGGFLVWAAAGGAPSKVPFIKVEFNLEWDRRHLQTEDGRAAKFATVAGILNHTNMVMLMVCEANDDEKQRIFRRINANRKMLQDY